MVNYFVIDEFGTASCSVIFERLEDGFIHVEYKFSQAEINDGGFEKLEKLVDEVETWKNELYYVSRQARNINWVIYIKSPDGNGNGILFECYGNGGPSIDLGLLAECYGDCETCDICHNTDKWLHNADCEDDDDFDYYTCRDCEGCHKHPCTKINGRKDLKMALLAKNKAY